MCLHMYAPCCTSYKRSRPLNMRSNPWIWRSSDLRTSHFEDPPQILGPPQIQGRDPKWHLYTPFWDLPTWCKRCPTPLHIGYMP